MFGSYFIEEFLILMNVIPQQYPKLTEVQIFRCRVIKSQLLDRAIIQIEQFSWKDGTVCNYHRLNSCVKFGNKKSNFCL